MQKYATLRRLAGGSLLAICGLSMCGCQIDVGGQTLPSPYYIYDDIQYFPAGPEFQLSQEAAVMKAAAEGSETDGP